MIKIFALLFALFVLPAGAQTTCTLYYANWNATATGDKLTQADVCSALVKGIWTTGGPVNGQCKMIASTNGNIAWAPILSKQATGAACVPPEVEPTDDEKCRVLGMLYNSWENGNREGRVPGKVPIGEPIKVCMDVDPEVRFGKEGYLPPPGCKHTFTADMSFSMDKDAKVWHSDGTSWADTDGAGLACVPGLDDAPGTDDKPKPMEPDPPCKGQAGTVNGKDVCIDASSGTTTASDKRNTTDANGNTSTTTTDVTCKGEQCTVTTTNISNSGNPSGGGGGTITTTNMSRDQYCGEHPRSAICRGPTDQSGETRGQGGSGSGSGDGDDDLNAPGAPGGAMPKLWEKKYPNGVKGVWDAKSADLKSSGLGSLASSLMPSVGDGGMQPSWQIDLDFGGHWNFGSFNLMPDPAVWSVLRAFTIISALVLARRLVFGG